MSSPAHRAGRKWRLRARRHCSRRDPVDCRISGGRRPTRRWSGGSSRLGTRSRFRLLLELLRGLEEILHLEEFEELSDQTNLINGWIAQEDLEEALDVPKLNKLVVFRGAVGNRLVVVFERLFSSGV